MLPRMMTPAIAMSHQSSSLINWYLLRILVALAKWEED